MSDESNRINRERGDREYLLRKRFENGWNAADDETRSEFITQAYVECKLDPDAKHDEFVSGLVATYAWTLFAEAQDPTEAKAIANSGWHSAATLANTARVEDIF